MSLALCLVVILQFWLTAANDLVARNNTPGFVSAQDGHFQMDGRQVRLYVRIYVG